MQTKVLTQESLKELSENSRIVSTSMNSISSTANVNLHANDPTLDFDMSRGISVETNAYEFIKIIDFSTFSYSRKCIHIYRNLSKVVAALPIVFFYKIDRIQLRSITQCWNKAEIKRKSDRKSPNKKKLEEEKEEGDFDLVTPKTQRIILSGMNETELNALNRQATLDDFQSQYHIEIVFDTAGDHYELESVISNPIDGEDDTYDKNIIKRELSNTISSDLMDGELSNTTELAKASISFNTDSTMDLGKHNFN